MTKPQDQRQHVWRRVKVVVGLAGMLIFFACVYLASEAAKRSAAYTEREMFESAANLVLKKRVAEQKDLLRAQGVRVDADGNEMKTISINEAVSFVIKQYAK